MSEGHSSSIAEGLVERLARVPLRLALAESCTAGLAADMIACVPGASAVLWGSFVAYTVSAKSVMLGIDADKIERYGAVSREIACAMAQGALEKSGADVAASVTGIAGPGGDGTNVPAGTVWIAVASNAGVDAELFNFPGGRADVRRAAAVHLAAKVLEHLSEKSVNGRSISAVECGTSVR